MEELLISSKAHTVEKEVSLRNSSISIHRYHHSLQILMLSRFKPASIYWSKLVLIASDRRKFFLEGETDFGVKRLEHVATSKLILREKG